MSDDTFKVLLTQVTDIVRVPDSEKLFSVGIMGWRLVSSGTFDEQGNLQPPYKVGDTVIYLEPNSMMDSKLIKHAFEGSQLKPDSPDSHRLKSIKLRGAISQGMILNPDKMLDIYPELAKKKLGDDVKDILNVVKYEPPAHSLPKGMQAKAKRKHPMFKEYIDLHHEKYYQDLFKEGEQVYITEKIHGTSARYSLLPTHIGPITQHVRLSKRYFVSDVKLGLKNLVKVIKKRLGLLNKFEFCIGSRRVHIDSAGYDNGYYDEDLYTKIAKQENLESKLQPNEQLFGEIIGSGVQGSYTYGYKAGQQGFFAYDVFNHAENRWLTPAEFINWCYDREINHVPVFCPDGSSSTELGPYKQFGLSYSKELLDNLKKGDSTIGKQKIREGVVVKSIDESTNPLIGRRVLKCISDAYLTQKGEITDFH